MPVILGAIADDFTGATDLANNLARAGMKVELCNGVPTNGPAHGVDAVVIALKSRTAPTDHAVANSLAALAWLRHCQVQQVYFKYCSTFDSWYAPERFGNIGPVTEALMQAMQCDFTIATPAFPDNGRTVFKGHLFVGDLLLQDSTMRDHPVTPMRESNLVNILQAQCQRRVGLIDHRTIALGEAAILSRIEVLRTEGVSIAIVDCVSNEQLMTIGHACRAMPLVTAASGVAIGLPQNFGFSADPQSTQLPAARGARAIVSGSCSAATNRQVEYAVARGMPALRIDFTNIDPTDAGIALASEQALRWARVRLSPTQPVLIYSTAQPNAVQTLQSAWGQSHAGEFIEQLLGRIAAELVTNGVGQLVIAGGETSGACVQALKIDQMQIGPQIAPGVPWCYNEHTSIHLALKSGNFGGDDFFCKVFSTLEQ
jgi:3-dehydrotetronate 4-kinase